MADISRYELIILNAIEEAKIANKKIVKLGLNKKVMGEISSMLGGIALRKNYFVGKKNFINQIGELYGIPVELSEDLQITTKI